MTIVPASRKEKGVIKRVYPKTSDRAVNLSDGRKLTEFVEEINQNKKSIEDINSTITSINVDTFSPVITQTTSMGKIGKDNNIDVSANVNDGFFKSAILKGNTVIDERKITWSGGKYLNHETGTLDAGLNLKPNHKYCEDYFVCKPSDSITFIGNSSYKKIVFYDENKTYINGHSGGAHNTDFTVTAPTNSKYFRMGYLLNGSIETVSIKINNVCIDGNYIDRKDKLISVKSPVLSTVGKNLFDYSIDNIYTTSSKTHYTPVLNEDGSIALNSCYDDPYWLERGFYVEKGKKYTVTVKGMKSIESYSALCFGFDNLSYFSGGEGKALIPAVTSTNCIDTVNTYSTKSMTCTALETGYVTRFYIHDSGLATKFTILEFQIEEGSTATSYEPYKSNILTTPEDLELRGIGNVQDTLDLMTGEVTQRIGYTEHLLQDLFKFSTGFGRGIQYDESSDRWRGHHNGINHSYFSNMLPLNFSITNDANSNVSIYGVGSDWFAFSVKSSELVSKGYEATAAGLLEYAKNEKMICTYELPNKVIKTVPINGEPLGFKDGHIMLSSGSDDYSLIPTLEYSVPVSKSAQITQNSSIIVNHAKQIYSLEMLLMTSSVEDAYQRLLLQNDVELTRSISDNLEPNPLRYVMLSKIIEEKVYDELDMLDKLDVFLLYNEITLEQYIELTDLILVVDTEVLE